MSFQKCLGNIKGDQGIQGPKGDTFKFSDLTNDDINTLLEKMKSLSLSDIYFDSETGVFFISDFYYTVINVDLNREIKNTEQEVIKKPGEIMFDEKVTAEGSYTIEFYPEGQDLHRPGEVFSYMLDNVEIDIEFDDRTGILSINVAQVGARFNKDTGLLTIIQD